MQDIMHVTQLMEMYKLGKANSIVITIGIAHRTVNVHCLQH